MNAGLFFEGGPTTREGPDLRDMARINMTSLVHSMEIADVVVAVSPDDTYVILRGEERMQGGAVLSFLVLQVANDTQAEMVAGVLMCGRLTPVQIEAFRVILTSVQDVRDSRN
jgi:hypothetical protein